MEWAPAGALGAPGAQTPWSGALRDKKCLLFFPIKCLVPVPLGSLKPLGPLWGPSGALRAPGAPGALTPWPIPHKKKVEILYIELESIVSTNSQINDSNIFLYLI